MPDKNRKLIDEFKALGAPAASPRPRATKVSQFEKDFRDYLAAQQEARQQLTSDLVSPSRIANAAVPGAVGALTGYGSQILGAPGDIVGLYEEFKPESFRSAPTSLQALPSTEQVQELFAPKADSFMGRRMPEYEAGITGGNLYALGEGVAALPSLARGVGRGAKALGKEAGRRIDEAMMTGQGMLGSALAPARPNFIKAYHGSPHRFAATAKNPLGEFDPTKIGTGEGAQAMGYGHYLAERPETARIYSADRAYVGATMQGKPTTVNFDDPIWIAQQTIDEFGDATKAKAHLEMVARTAGKYQSAETKAQLKDAIDLVASNKVSPKGSVYKVDLSDEAVPRMLDYDKPFSQQSENVRNAFEHLVAPIRKIEAQPSGPEWGDLASAINYDPTGRELLQLLSTNKSMNAQNVLTGGVTPAVAERIRSMGIPGIKYLDQFSRDKGTGTRNFVVFPGGEDLLTIEERMKKGGPVSRDAMQIKAWDKQVQGKAAGGLSKVGKGIGKVIDAVADAKAERMKALIESERALPLRLPRAPAKTKQELARHAERVGRQMLGEHITSGKPGVTKNLAGRSRKENERIKSIEYELEPTKVIPQSTVHQSRVGDINVAFPGDYTASDVQLKTLQGEPIGSVQQGGSRFGLGKLDMKNPLFWASNEGPAQLAQDKITDMAHLYEPERVMAQHLAMGRVANNFAQHFADASLRSIDYSKMSSKDMNLFDRIIAGGYDKKNQKTGEVESITFPHWPGIADPEAAMSAMKADPELRKWFLSRMKTPKVTTATNMPNGLDIEWAITSPDLRNMEVNLTGHSVGEMVPGASLTDTANHETYTKGIQGRYMGHQEALSPFVISYPDAAQHIASTQRPEDFTGTIQKVFPHQIVDPQYIDEMGEYTRQLNRVLTGKKKGGAVHMAEGGMTSDDLIVEERPL